MENEVPAHRFPRIDGQLVDDHIWGIEALIEALKPKLRLRIPVPGVQKNAGLGHIGALKPTVSEFSCKSLRHNLKPQSKSKTQAPWHCPSWESIFKPPTPNRKSRTQPPSPNPDPQAKNFQGVKGILEYVCVCVPLYVYIYNNIYIYLRMKYNFFQQDPNSLKTLNP